MHHPSHTTALLTLLALLSLPLGAQPYAAPPSKQGTKTPPAKTPPSKAKTEAKQQPKTALPSLPRYSSPLLSIAALCHHAKAHNSTLARLRRKIHLLVQRASRAAPWPDLRVGVTGSNFPLPNFDPTKTAMSGIEYSISQTFPILKRLKLQKKLADFNTAMAKEILRERQSTIYFQLHKAVYWLSYLRKALHIEEELHQLTGQAAVVAKTKYTVGKAPQQHYLQALTNQSVIHNRMVILVAKERIWRHRLQRLLGPQHPLSQASAPTTLPSLPLRTLPKYLHTALAQRGSIRRWRLASQQARMLLSFAKIRYWPDVTVRLAVRQRFPNPLDQGAPFLSLGLKVPIPSWGNAARHGLVKEAMARHQWAQSRIRELQTQFREQLQITLTTHTQVQRQIQIAAQHTIPLAMQTYRSALSNYQVDKVDFLTLLSNLRTLFSEKLRLDRLRTTRATLRARLYAISGQFPHQTNKGKP